MKPKSLLSCVTYPATIRVRDADLSPLDLARAIVDDDHPGDDVIPPRWLRDSCVAGVKLVTLRRLVKEAGGSLALTPGVLPKLVTMGADELCIMAHHAAGNIGVDVDGRAFKVDDAALVVVLAALIYEAETTATERKAHAVVAHAHAEAYGLA